MISPEEAAESGELVNLAVAVGALSGDARAQALQQSGGFPLVEVTAEKALQMQRRAVEQAVTWCRGFSIDGGKTWSEGRLVMEREAEDPKEGRLWVYRFPQTLWPSVVARIWSGYTAAQARAGRFPGPGLPAARGDGPEAREERRGAAGAGVG